MLFYGTSAAVELAARILTPQERIEKVEETRREYASQESKLLSDNPDDAVNQVVIKGTVRTRDGKPLPKRMTFVTDTKDWKGNGYCKSEDANRGSFSITAPAGTTWLFVTNHGYVPGIVGPLVAKPGETIADIQIMLEKGEPRIVRIEDEQGKPIKGVAVNVRQMLDSNDFQLEYREYG